MTSPSSEYDDGMTKEEAEYFRKHRAIVYGCFECIRLGRSRRYWWPDQLRFVKHRNYCPEHFKEQIPSTDSQPIVKDLEI